jgi:hypothetical protein
LTPKGRLWELAEGTLNLRFPESKMEEVECQDGAFVLDWVVNENDFAIALMDDGREELGSVLGAGQKMFYATLLVDSAFRCPEEEQEDESMCARLLDISACKPARLRDRMYSGHQESG